MSAETDRLRDLYLSVAGDEPITESQEEDHSRDPIEGNSGDLGHELSHLVRNTGLEDAIEGAGT